MIDAEVVRGMWRSFTAYPPAEQYILNTSHQSPEQTVSVLQARLAEGDDVLK